MTMMSSWRLLRTLISFWTSIDNPIFVRETTYPPMWYRMAARLSEATGVVLALGGLGCYISVLLTFYLNNLLVLLAPALVLWIVLIASSLGPVIVLERERRTWETLRTVPLPTEMILLGKAGGALWWLRDLIRIMGGILLLVAVGIGLVSLVVIPNASDSNLDVLPTSLICGAFLVLPVLSAVVYILDRAQQFVLMAVAALAVSAQSQTVRTAMSGAVVAALILWMIDAGMAIVMLALLPHGASAPSNMNIMALVTLGPIASYLSALSLVYAAVTIAGTLALREIVIRVLWAWVVRAAQNF